MTQLLLARQGHTTRGSAAAGRAAASRRRADCDATGERTRSLASSCQDYIKPQPQSLSPRHRTASPARNQLPTRSTRYPHL